MNVFLLYALLLKATVTSFSGLASLPMVRNDLVVERKILTDRELNTAVVAPIPSASERIAVSANPGLLIKSLME